MTDTRVTLSGVETAAVATDAPRVGLAELAWTFFIIGITGFGGGMAIVALIQQICVEKKRWLTSDEFAHGVALSQFLGAFAVNTTTFVGYRLRGLAGAIVAVSAFLLPGVAAITVLAALYFRYQHLPALQTMLHGIGPVVVAVILTAAFRMGKGRMGDIESMLLAAMAFIALYVLSVPVPAIVLGLVVYGFGRNALVGGREPS